MKLLIGYDGSKSSGEAVDDLRRAGLAEEGVEATVMSIADLLPGVIGEDLVVDYPLAMKRTNVAAGKAVEEARRLSAEGAQRVGRLFPAWRVAAQDVMDSPYWGLVKTAEQMRPDLLVVGSHGRSALGRLMLGSVSHNAILYAPCPVRVGRCPRGAGDGSGPLPARIIVGWDGSIDASWAIKAVGSRRWAAGSVARVVMAIDVSLATALPAAVPAEMMAQGFGPVVREVDDSLRERARAMVEQLRATGVEVEDPVLREGDAKRVLLKEAEAWPADCIFVGARGLSRLERVLLGSVSSGVAARAPCSVEVVRGQDDGGGENAGAPGAGRGQ